MATDHGIYSEINADEMEVNTNRYNRNEWEVRLPFTGCLYVPLDKIAEESAEVILPLILNDKTTIGRQRVFSALAEYLSDADVRKDIVDCTYGTDKDAKDMAKIYNALSEILKQIHET